MLLQSSRTHSVPSPSGLGLDIVRLQHEREARAHAHAISHMGWDAYGLGRARMRWRRVREVQRCKGARGFGARGSGGRLACRAHRLFYGRGQRVSRVASQIECDKSKP